MQAFTGRQRVKNKMDVQAQRPPSLVGEDIAKKVKMKK